MIDLVHWNQPLAYDQLQPSTDGILYLLKRIAQTLWRDQSNWFQSISKVAFIHVLYLFWCYSSVPNRRACTFINFEKKIPPCRALFWSACLMFLRKNSPCTFTPSCTCIGICPARLLILRKTSPLHGLILVCTFFKNFPTCTFILPYTSIPHTRVM